MAFGVDDSDADDDSAPTSTVEISDLAGEAGGDKGRRLAAYWKDQLDQVDKDWESWNRRVDTIERRYRDDRNRIDEEGQRRSNNFWANVQIIMPALYGRCPQPVVERRYKDKDPIGRSASMILERALRSEQEPSQYDDSVGSAVLDYLLGGLGINWCRYEPEFEPGLSIPVTTQHDLRDAEGRILDDDDDREEGPDAETEAERTSDEEKLEDTGDRLKRESAPVDFINRRDFRMLPSGIRRWSECRAVAKRCYMSRDQMRRRFGDEIGDAIPLQKDNKEKRGQYESRMAEEHKDAKGEIWEIWSKDDLRVFWVAEGYEYLCDEKDDFLKLENFFPTPKPLLANPTNDTIVPVPDYAQYQDQSIQIDELTSRIARLSRACKIAGTYNAACDELARLFDESVENELIPVDAWAAFAEKGGLEGQISLLPLKDIVETIKTLHETKEAQQSELDRLTGITEILRGVQTDGRVTLGGQKMQGNNGRTRLQARQSYVGKYCASVVKIQAEIMCKHFSAQTLIEESGALYEEGLGIADVMSLGFGGGSEALQAPPTPIQGPGGTVPRLGAVAPQLLLGPPPGSSPMPGGPPPAPPSAGLPSAPGGPPPTPSLAPPGAPSPPQPPASPFGQFMPEMELAQALRRISTAIALLRNDHKRGFRIEIDVDSHIMLDEEAERESRNEFLTTVTKFLEVSMQIGGAQPQIVPLLGKFLQFGVRGYRVGRELESSIEQYIDQMEQHAKQMANQPKPPDPRMIMAQADMEDANTKKMEAQIKGMEAKAKLMALGGDQQAENTRAQAEITKAHMQMQGDAFKAHHDQQTQLLELEEKKLALEERKIELQIKIAELNMKGQEAQHTTEQHQMMLTNESAKAQREADAAAQNEMREQARAQREADSDAKNHERETQRDARDQARDQQSAQFNQLLTQHLSAPRRVVRDRNGRVSGVVLDGGKAQNAS